MEEREKLTDKAIDKLLKEPEINALKIWLQEPGFEAVKKLAEAVRDDWADQITRIDYRFVQDESIVKDMIFKQGMLHGIDQFVVYLKTKQKKWSKDNDEQ